MQKRGNFQSIKEIVLAHTGMSEKDLIFDERSYDVANVREAAAMLRKFFDKTIYIVGDYDVDGISASTIMKMALEKAGAGSVKVRLPKRFSEGYGMSPGMIDEFEAGNLIVTVDNGIAAHEAIDKAKARGFSVIVTDHHLPVMDESGNAVLPNADIVIDPHAIPGSADFDDYCGAGLAYKIAEVLTNDKLFLRKLIGIAAIATIADSVSLTMENRRIVKTGLQAILYPQTATTGMRAILEALQLESKINTEKVQFQIAPLLNAPGRLYDDGSMEAFQLVSFEGDDAVAAEMAGKLVSDNNERKLLTKEGFEQADKLVTDDRPIVIAHEGIHEGLAGVIAAKIAEKYQTPAFVLTKSEHGYWKGSGRSFGGIHLKNLLDEVQDTLRGYGGHAEAAGISVESERLDDFKAALQNAMKGFIMESLDTEVYYDLEIKPTEIEDAIRELEKYEPYGEGNPLPVFLVRDHHLVPHGSSHYKELSTGTGVKLYGEYAEITAFGSEDNNMARKYEAMGCPRNIDAVGTLSLDSWKGKSKNHMKATEIKESERQVKQPVRRNALSAMLAKRAQTRRE